MSSTSSYIEKLLLSHLMTEPVIREAVDWLDLPVDSRGLDAGCGIGLHLPIMLDAVGKNGHVTGLDISREFLDYGEVMLTEKGLVGRFSLKQGGVERLPFNDDQFDWAWSCNLVGYYSGHEPVPSLKELSRVVRPNGTVAVIFWSSQQLLPGYPMIEARLNATSAGIAPFSAGMDPKSHSIRGLVWFRDAGLKDAAVKTFLGEVRPPLSDKMKDAMASLFDMRWGGARSEVAEETWGEYLRLTEPGSADFILNLDDYYAFFTYTMFWGVV
ncbi:MAG: methyltransferase domain-containing protein [Deltaproteobacteria bacterium]|uniref:Methyltransferase domain-containing protein n=1 Tax=Candidatus Zymogenus saltonus TaxID=2844893 RepID=A0A9D8PNY0_9DELT|nr:methyltransferase domain-containing protein [Candidatus Zymogenus saltonus]